MPKMKLGKWVKADRVRVTKKNGERIVEVRRVIKRNRPRKRKRK